MNLKKILEVFKHPEIKNIDRNSVEYYQFLMKQVRKNGSYLNKLYNEYYQILVTELDKNDIDRSGCFIELGSGYGFFKDFCAKRDIELIRTDVVEHGNIDRLVNAEKIDFPDKSISAIFLLGVLHHIKNVDNFFSEATRVLRPGGGIIMIEPTANKYSEFMYRNSHSEPFNKDVSGWQIEGDDPMTCANLALPHIVFERDLSIFNLRYKHLKVLKNEYHSPLLFQLGGAGPFRPPLGDKSFEVVKFVDRLLSPFNKNLGMFSTIVIKKGE